ncbi:DEKNAAC104205 [Brettanomyces naardenensis]|uniref:DEKNAAC104205 n=1 Tax=Brettanomyces naardenensis TaxID=13370 RepID=A0A448YQ77_BRENA|nr:DEKNAAC104205 [Brettanomyces naardenensis]
MLNQLLCTLLLSGLVASTPLGPVPHHHKHLQRRQAVAVAEADVETVVVTVYQDASPTTLQTSYVSPAAESEFIPASSAVSSAAPAPAASSAVPSSPSSSSSGSSGSSLPASAAAGSVEYYAEGGKGIAYSPYTDSGSCKSESTIASDIQLLSDFSIIRVYAPDCNCVSAILGSIGSNQKLFAGLFYLDSLSTDISTLASQVQSSSQGWDGIYAVSVGNEWVNDGLYSASQVAQAVSSGRSQLSSQGYNGQVVTVDTLVAYENNPELCSASDFIAANSHPFWDGNVDPSNSGPWLQEQISNVKSACGGSKDVLITETGWPTQGSTYGSKGVPSTQNQLSAIQSISETVGGQVIFFTTYNDFWKQPGPYGVEQYWGIFSN